MSQSWSCTVASDAVLSAPPVPPWPLLPLVASAPTKLPEPSDCLSDVLSDCPGRCKLWGAGRGPEPILSSVKTQKIWRNLPRKLNALANLQAALETNDKLIHYSYTIKALTSPACFIENGHLHQLGIPIQTILHKTYLKDKHTSKNPWLAAATSVKRLPRHTCKRWSDDFSASSPEAGALI